MLKVFHAARQDIKIFVLRFGAVPTPLFDTQIAAMVAGFGDQVSYEALVGGLTGGAIDKAHRFSDWSARPLSAAQIAYAAANVTHLRDVYRRLSARLEEDGRLDWVAEEMAALPTPRSTVPIRKPRGNGCVRAAATGSSSAACVPSRPGANAKHSASTSPASA